MFCTEALRSSLERTGKLWTGETSTITDWQENTLRTVIPFFLPMRTGGESLVGFTGALAHRSIRFFRGIGDFGRLLRETQTCRWISPCVEALSWTTNATEVPIMLCRWDGSIMNLFDRAHRNYETSGLTSSLSTSGKLIGVVAGWQMGVLMHNNVIVLKFEMPRRSHFSFYQLYINKYKSINEY